MESYRVLVLVGTSQCKKNGRVMSCAFDGSTQRLLITKLLITNYCINMCNVASFSNSQLCSSNPKPMEISQNLEAFLDNFDNTFPSWRCWDAEVLKVGGRVSISDVLSTLVPLGWWILALWHGTHDDTIGEAGGQQANLYNIQILIQLIWIYMAEITVIFLRGTGIELF